MKRTALLLLCLIGMLGMGLSAQEEQEEFASLGLKLGDPDLKDKILEVRPDVIFSAATGRAITFEEMIVEMADTRIIHVGESHNSLPMHQIQARIIRSLYEQNPELTIGLEMFTPLGQEHLNKWSMGLLTEKEFIREGNWYVAWNFNFGFYAEIFAAAKSLRIPIHGLNAPREIISKLRMRGYAALTDEEKAQVPDPDVTHQEHRAYIRATFENMEMPHAMQGPGLDKVFEGLYRAQSAWDEVMSDNMLRALEYTRKRMVVLAGSGHLMYNLGINRRALEKSGWPSKTVVCVVVPEGRDSLEVSRSLGDYVWGLAEEDRPAYPSIGLRLKTFDHLANPVVEREPIDGVAQDAGFEKGDVILSVGDHSFSNINTLRIYLAHFTWGDTVNFQVLRDGQVKTIEVLFELKEEEE
ncbi:MAG: ChaN family lipoprotein [Candidatus Aminicenantaceae bacterium]